jgi:Tfp pilus assembly major pilin PilA
MALSAAELVSPARARRQRGVTLIGLLFWAVVVSTVGLIALKVLPSLNEYFTIQRAVNKLASSSPGSVPEIRNAFERQKDIEYSISSLSGKDLEITKENEQVVIKFGYDKEIELIAPVYLVIKYRGRSQ